MTSNVATQLAKFVVQTRFSDIPKEVVDFAKGLMLKTVAGSLAGSATPSGRKMSNTRYIEACSKVDVTIHPDRSPILVQAPGDVIIKMKNGKKISRQRMRTIGSRQEPLSPMQFRELYSKFTKGIFPNEQTDKTAEAILSVDKLNDILGLMNMLTFTHT